MKRLRINLTVIFILSVLINITFSEVGTVISWDAQLYSDMGLNNKLTNLPPASVVTIEKIDNTVCKVSYKNIKGFMKIRNLSIYKGLFSNIGPKTVISPDIFKENGKWYLYYYHNGKINKLNVNERFVENSQKLEEIYAIYSSHHNDLLVLEGITTNNQETHHYMVYNFNSGKSSYIGSFPEDNIKITGIGFPDNASYLSLKMDVEGNHFVAIYKTDNGEAIAFAKDTLNVNWLGQSVLLNNNRFLWYYGISDSIANMDISYSKEFDITRIKSEWLRNGSLESAVRDDEYFINTPQGVIKFDISTKETSKTPFKSLLWNHDKNLNYYLKNDSVYLKDLKVNTLLNEFCGQDPKVDFIEFCQTNFIGKKKYDKIDSLFLFSMNGQEVYRYCSIDNPSSISEIGILAELNIEKNLSLITIENPHTGQFYFITLTTNN